MGDLVLPEPRETYADLPRADSELLHPPTFPQKVSEGTAVTTVRTPNHDGGYSANSTPRRSVVRIRRSGAHAAGGGTCSDGSRPSRASTPPSPSPPFPKREADRNSDVPNSSLRYVGNGNAAAVVNGEHTASNGDARVAVVGRRAKVLTDISPTPRSRGSRRQVLTCAPNRGTYLKLQLSLERTGFTSPERLQDAACFVARTREDVKRYVHVVMARHVTTLSAWEKRISVTEVYRNKPLRTGGRPVPVRSQDHGFLEHILPILDGHLQQLEGAQLLLARVRENVPPTRSGVQGDVKTWRDYCIQFCKKICDLVLNVKLLHTRVERLLSGGVKSLLWPMRASSISPRSLGGYDMRSRTNEATSARSSPMPTSRAASRSLTPRRQLSEKYARLRSRSVRSGRSMHSTAVGVGGEGERNGGVVGHTEAS